MKMTDNNLENINKIDTNYNISKKQTLIIIILIQVHFIYFDYYNLSNCVYINYKKPNSIRLG